MRKPEEQISQVKHIFSRLAPYYDLGNRVISLRQDIKWRRFTATAMRLPAGARVLDVATGTGDLALDVASLPGRPKVMGLDLVPQMLLPAQKKAARMGVDLPLLAGDAMALPFGDNLFDAATIAFGIRNIPDRVGAMAEMARVLKPGGRLYVLEFTLPPSPWFNALYKRYLMRLLPALGGLFSGEKASYQYLAETIAEFPGPPQFRAEMQRAGLAAPRSHSLTRGIAWLHVAEKS